MSDVEKFPQLAQEEISGEWGISTLADGRIHGKGYSYRVDRKVNDAYDGNTCGEKLIVKGIIDIK